ncbi:MAG: S-layer homology domain-containing protein [Thermoleophilia bacterium]|nr:S-layer homology domain-containing protein [Thermoleophilia bacterium]
MRPRLALASQRGKGRRRRRVLDLTVGALVALALVVSVASLAGAAAAGFSDVPATHPHHAAITDLASRGIISGYENGRFGPSDPVKRQQFAKMIVLTGAYPVSEADQCLFKDVEKSGPTGFYPDNYIAVCAARGITQGVTPSSFNPQGHITRLQVTSMVVRAAGDLKPDLLDTPPPGWTPSGSWSLDATHGANALVAEYNGLLEGLDLWALNPTAPMPRGEVAQVLHNLLVELVAATTTTTTAAPTTTTTLAPTTTTSSTTTSSTTTLYIPNPPTTCVP